MEVMLPLTVQHFEKCLLMRDKEGLLMISIMRNGSGYRMAVIDSL